MDKWFCTKCGAPNEGKFCVACGSPKLELPTAPAEQPGTEQPVEQPIIMQSAEQPVEQPVYTPQPYTYTPAGGAQTAYAPVKKPANKKKLPGGAIAGIIIGALAVVAVVVLLIFMGTPMEVTLDSVSEDMLVGDTVQLEATVTRFLAKPTVNDVEWSTSNSGIATVKGGSVEAMEEGSAVITATVDNKSASCSISSKWRTVKVGSSDYKINSKTLDLSSTGVSDLTPLTEFFQLEELDLTGNPVSDVSVLSYMPTLKYVTLNDTNVTDVSDIIDRMDVTMSLDAEDYSLGFGETMAQSAADFNLNVGGASINWTSANNNVAVVGDTLVAKDEQDSLDAFDGTCRVTGKVPNSHIELNYYITVAPDALTYDTYWPYDSETVTTSSYRATVYPLHITPDVVNAYGITFEYIIYKGDSGDAAKRDFAVRVRTTAGSWKKVGTITAAYDTWMTATLLFDNPMSFTEVVLLPNTACTWDDNYVITSIIFAPRGTEK